MMYRCAQPATFPRGATSTALACSSGGASHEMLGGWWQRWAGALGGEGWVPF